MSTAHELRRRLARGLRLGAAGVAAGRPGRAAVGGARPLETSTAPSTALGEAALLCRVTGRLLADDPALARLEGLGAAQARLGQVLTRALDARCAGLRIAAHPRTGVREALPFTLLGDLDTEHRTAARHLLVMADTGPGEEPDAAHDLEHAWLRHLAAGSTSAPPLPAGSVLERGADLLHGEPDDAHGLTRAVLHASDCGLAAVRTTRPAAAVADDAEALLGAALAVGHLDLAAELLWTWPMLGIALSTGARHALGELDRAEARYGFLPGPLHDPAVAAGLAPAERSAYVIRTSHHTAVAGGVLAAALLRSDLADPLAVGGPSASGCRVAPPRASGRSTPAADPLPLLVLADGPWADALRAAPPDRRAACAPLVLGAELRAAARKDPARVHHVVAWAAEHGWDQLPSVRQGIALLSAAGHPAAAPAVVAGC